MKVSIINEAGYEEACLGLSLSYNSTIERAKEVALKLASKDGGHNKFLESIVVWIDITAARYWWQQASTYRVGTSTQSASTMHTLMRRLLTRRNFETPLRDTWINDMNYHLKRREFLEVKSLLPESFLQRRIMCVNYKSLRNMILQRRNHKLPEWQQFCKTILEQVQHPKLLPEGK